MRRLAFPLIVTACLAAAAHARADNGTAAQALFEEGRKLMAAGSYAEACPKLAESQRLDPGAGTLLNLALCYEKSERFASAWATYNEAAADADKSGRGEWVKKAKDKVAALAPALSTLTISVAPSARVEGLEIVRDGHVIHSAEWGVKVPVDGGEHTVHASAPGREPWSAHVTAAPKHGVLVVAVPALALAPAGSASRDRDRDREHEKEKPIVSTKGSGQRTIGLIVAGAGIVGLGVGGFFTWRATSKHDDAKGNCDASETHCNPQGLSDYSAANSAADIATIGLIAGGALLVGGVVLYLTAPRGTATTPTALARGWTF